MSTGTSEDISPLLNEKSEALAARIKTILAGEKVKVGENEKTVLEVVLSNARTKTGRETLSQATTLPDNSSADLHKASLVLAVPGTKEILQILFSRVSGIVYQHGIESTEYLKKYSNTASDFYQDFFFHFCANIIKFDPTKAAFNTFVSKQLESFTEHYHTHFRRRKDTHYTNIIGVKQNRFGKFSENADLPRGHALWAGDQCDSPLSQLIAEETAHKGLSEATIHAAVDKLPPNERELFTAILSGEQIAPHAMHKQYNVTQGRYNQAANQLKKELGLTLDTKPSMAK